MMRERVDLKSPVRENRPPGSVRGAPGNRCPYLDCILTLLRRGARILPAARASSPSSPNLRGQDARDGRLEALPHYLGVAVSVEV
jgi:hypothetical protein